MGKPGVRKRDGLLEYFIPAYLLAKLAPEDRWKLKKWVPKTEGYTLLGDTMLMEPSKPFPVIVRPEGDAWAYGFLARLDLPDTKQSVIKAVARVKKGVAGFGILDSQNNFLYRTSVAANDSNITVYLPIMEAERAANLVIQSAGGTDPLELSLENLTLFDADTEA
jgi:hypothetical protein